MMMAKVIRKVDKKVLANLNAAIKGFDNLKLKVGWFETNKYPDGTPVAYVASIQEFGVSFTHPGGTQYVIRDGKAVFVKNSFTGPVAGVTGAHAITIPPRPFMRPAIAQNENNWSKVVTQLSKQVLKGSITAEGMMDGLGGIVSGAIAKAITDVSSPPLTAGTIATKRARMADKGTTGSLDKPLVETRLMFDSVTHVVEQ